MPAFEMAVELAFKNGYENRVGIHFNLTLGKPLSRSILSCPRLCDEENYFIYKRNFVLFRWSEIKAIREELSAQIERIREVGIPISHFDSHHHIHTEFFLFLIICDVLKKYGIRKVRISNNMDVGKGGLRCLLKKVYKLFFNRMLRVMGFKTTRFMGDYNASVDHISAYGDCDIELMCHPVEMNGLMMDKFKKEPLKQHVLQLQPYMNL